MCGIVGIAGVMPVNQSIYDALTVLQHRGQDAAGIITIDANNCFRLRKANGLVSDVFEARHMQRLQGNMGIGHVRYPTAGSSSASEAQPFYVNSPYGITLAHNGNLTNAHELRKKLFEEKRRHINTTSDSEILLNIFVKNVDVEIPRDKLTVITGLSGSGKSSLAFDTIYAEGQRRYMETLSTYARQFVGTMERPDVDKITGLSPVISIEQKTTNKNPRSTVGTVTEINDFLRLLFGSPFTLIRPKKIKPL